MKTAVEASMDIDELLITGYAGAASRYAVCLSADKAKVIRPCAGEDGEDVVGEAFEKATNAFKAIRDLMNEIVEQ